MYCQTLKELKLSKVVQNDNPKLELMILAAEGSSDEINELINWANNSDIKIWGGIFPKVIANGQTYKKGFIAKSLAPIYSELINPLTPEKLHILNSEKKYTGIIIADGFSEKTETFIKSVNTQTPANINFIGACSGRYTNNFGIFSLESDVSIFNNMGFHKDALHLCILEEESQTEVVFGWEVLDGPFKVTNSKDKIICELNHEVPFELYQYTIQEAENILITQDNFFVYSTSYPFATMENGHMRNIMIPTEVNDDGYFKFLYELTKDDNEIYIMKANRDSFINEIKESLDVNMNLNDSTVFSCFSREMLLQDQYTDEINSIDQRHARKSEGALSFGEISNKNDKNELRIHAGACIVTLQ